MTQHSAGPQGVGPAETPQAPAEVEQLEQLAHRLGELARDVAVPPVRFVKTIGDAVMLAAVRGAEMAKACALAPTGMSAVLSAFFASLQTAAATPSDVSARQLL